MQARGYTKITSLRREWTGVFSSIRHTGLNRGANNLQTKNGNPSKEGLPKRQYNQIPAGLTITSDD